MDEWYYAESDSSKEGPVDETRLVSLNERGDINSKTLVWKEGMPEWQPLHTIASELYADEESGPVETAVCAQSDMVLPKSRMVPYGDVWIAEDRKDAFVQTLMETGEEGLVDPKESALEYVGFWWRVLSAILDTMVKLIPNWIFGIPYLIVSMSEGFKAANSDGGPTTPFDDMSVAMVVTLGIQMLGQLFVSIFYETWMVGKYQATVGKMVIGAKVVNPDGSKLTYGRSFLRWVIKKPLNMLILYVPGIILMVIIIAMGAKNMESNPEQFIGMLLGGYVALFVGMGLMSFVYWMAGPDKEKRTLHDRIASTRVVKK